MNDGISINLRLKPLVSTYYTNTEAFISSDELTHYVFSMLLLMLLFMTASRRRGLNEGKNLK